MQTFPAVLSRVRTVFASASLGAGQSLSEAAAVHLETLRLLAVAVQLVSRRRRRLAVCRPRCGDRHGDGSTGGRLVRFGLEEYIVVLSGTAAGEPGALEVGMVGLGFAAGVAEGLATRAVREWVARVAEVEAGLFEHRGRVLGRGDGR